MNPIRFLLNNDLDAFYNAMITLHIKATLEAREKSENPNTVAADEVDEIQYPILARYLDEIPLTHEATYSTLFNKICNLNPSAKKFDERSIFRIAVAQQVLFNILPEKRAEQQIKDLDQQCENYQNHLLRKLNKVSNLIEGGAPQIPGTIMIDEAPLKKHSHQLYAKQYNKTVELRTILQSKHDPSDKLGEFKRQFKDSEVKKLFTQRHDPYAKRFIKNVGMLLSNIFFGAALIYSKFSKGSFSFWKSHGECATERMEEILKPTIQANQ